MQKQLFLASCLLLTLCAFSQINVNDLFIGGALGYEGQGEITKPVNSNQTTDKYTSGTQGFSIIPRVGYFIKNNLAIGLSASYTHTTEKYNTYLRDFPQVGTLTEKTHTTKTNHLSCAIFGRYVYQLTENFYISSTAFLGAGHGTSKTTIEYREQNSSNVDILKNNLPKYSSVFFSLNPEIIYFPTKRIGLEASVGRIFHYGYIREISENFYGNEIESRRMYFDLFNVNSVKFTFGLNYYMSLIANK
ncbi:MAG: hypothetical protein NZ519_02660 [Bacteroidia bacterium]|nr:hypothetical protein [Bacteroidia bacterium]MDW8302364.1 hypothetical protein [Bacteroidia bacterium]